MNVKKVVLILLCAITSACIPLAPAESETVSNPLSIETAIALTFSAAVAQTALVSTAQAQDIEVTQTPASTETPSSPMVYVYEGLSASCICNACGCLSNITFTVNLTIDSQGNVVGVLEKYLPDAPSIELEGTKQNIYGLYQVENEKIEFIGNLSDNLNMLEAALLFEGKNEDGSLYSGKRTMILFKK